MPKGRVLIVDDSALQRVKMGDVLRGAGYEVLVADDGLVGLHIAIKERPHMVISDIQMPTLDGIAFCKALKKHGNTRSIPVVFLSTLDSLDDVVRGLEAGASDYLSKQTDGSEQLLSMTDVHTKYSRRLRAKERLEDPPSAPDAGEEFQIVRELPATFFDGLTMGMAIANLRRRPIYVNPSARRLLGYDEEAPLAAISGPEFEDLLTQAARGYQAQPKELFYDATHQGRALRVHLEQVFSARRQICGVMVLIDPTARH